MFASFYSHYDVCLVTPFLQTFRVPTPPSTDKKPTWGKRSIELDPKSDSSGDGDFLVSLSCL